MQVQDDNDDDMINELLNATDPYYDEEDGGIDDVDVGEADVQDPADDEDDDVHDEVVALPKPRASRGLLANTKVVGRKVRFRNTQTITCTHTNAGAIMELNN
jgi:hypothetical protein